MAVRRPLMKTQTIDPTTTLDPYICTLECGAMGLDIRTNGAINVWGGNLVPWCGKSASQIIGQGTNLHNVNRAWQHWNQTLDIRTGNKWAAALSDLNNGYWLILQGDYDQFSYETRCQDSFLGDHAIIVGPEKNSGGWLTADPLCRNWAYTPEGELKRYAEKLAKRVYTGVYGYWLGQIFFARIKPRPLPDTSVEDDMAAYKSTIVSRFNGKVKVKTDARHAAVTLYDGKFVWLPGNTVKDAYAKIRITPAIPGGKVGANRRDGYLVGAEEAILLLSDVEPV